MSAITPLVQSGADLDCRSVPSGHPSARLRKQPILTGGPDAASPGGAMSVAISHSQISDIGVPGTARSRVRFRPNIHAGTLTFSRSSLLAALVRIVSHRSMSTLVSLLMYSGVPLWQCVSSKKRYDSTPHLIYNHTRSPSTSKLTARYSVLHEFAVGACSRDDASVAKFHR